MTSRDDLFSIPVAHGRQVEVVEDELDLLQVLFIDQAVDVVVTGDVDGVVVWVVGARHDAARFSVALHHLIALWTRRQMFPSLSQYIETSLVRSVQWRIQACMPRTGATNGLRHGTHFGVPVREEVATVCVGMRGDAGSACQIVARMFKMITSRNMSCQCQTYFKVTLTSCH